ncbi:MAG: YqjF family protein [Prosthecobacter sp.]
MPDAATSALLSARERPARPHVMLQRWEQLAFLHWRWDPNAIQRTLPPGLTVDTFQDSAWLAIVPFFMRGIRPRFCPPVLGISDFLELNVRTYVRDEKGRHGVWFYSLDCDQPLAVWTARTFFHLPYQHARMSATVNGSQVDYQCHRRGQPDESRFSWSIGNPIHHAEPGTLEFFLAERYLLHSKTPHGLRCGQVHHAPYPLAELQLCSWDANPLIQAGFENPKRPPDHLTGSLGVNVRIYALTS